MTLSKEAIEIAVGVKSLQWVPDADGDETTSNAAVVEYSILGPDRHGLFELVFDNKIIKTDSSKEAVKSFAQSHYEALILSALISSPGKDGGQEVEAEEVPVLFVSEKQLPNCIGTYLPTRKHREGNFQMPLYARPQPASTSLVERLAEELTAAASLLETLSEELPDDDVSGVMMRVMAERNRSALSASTSREGDR